MRILIHISFFAVLLEEHISDTTHTYTFWVPMEAELRVSKILRYLKVNSFRGRLDRRFFDHYLPTSLYDGKSRTLLTAPPGLYTSSTEPITNNPIVQATELLILNILEPKTWPECALQMVRRNDIKTARSLTVLYVFCLGKRTLILDTWPFDNAACSIDALDRGFFLGEKTRSYIHVLATFIHWIL